MTRKRKIIVAVFGVLTVAIFTYAFYVRSKTSTGPILPTPSSTPGYEVQEVPKEVLQQIEKFGEPLNGPVPATGSAMLEFKSKSQARNNQVVYENGKAVFVREILIDKSLTIDSIKKVYKEPEIVMYGELSEVGFNLYAYPSSGFAYIGSPQAGDILETWYFSPITKETFMGKWAKDYSAVPREGGF